MACVARHLRRELLQAGAVAGRFIGRVALVFGGLYFLTFFFDIFEFFNNFGVFRRAAKGKYVAPDFSHLSLNRTFFDFKFVH